MKTEKQFVILAYFMGASLSLIALSLLFEILKKGPISFFTLLSLLLMLTIGLAILKSEHKRSRNNTGGQ